jgi:hypothetical protein
MNDLRKAAEMALKQIQRDDVYLGHRSKTRADAITALRQALDDKPPVKTYAGGKPNYCTPDVDAVNMSQESVDETAKGEHEPIGYIDGMHGGYMVFTPINPSAVYLNGTALYLAPPKKEWVGLTEGEFRAIGQRFENDNGHVQAWMSFARHIQFALKEKNT